MTKDPVLEALSDKVRCGEPIDFLDAIAVINYQEQRRQERIANSLSNRFRLWVRSVFKKLTGEAK